MFQWVFNNRLQDKKALAFSRTKQNIEEEQRKRN